MNTIRGNRIAMIFQEPMTSLNPVFTCGRQVMESILLHRKVSRAEAKQQTIELFEKVNLPEPAAIIDRYPHQLRRTKTKGNDRNGHKLRSCFADRR